MPIRFGPGPVFIHDSIAACRRWQLYALRCLFVLGLLAALSLVLYSMTSMIGDGTRPYSIRALATLGQYFYSAISTVQLVLVLLVAPAATAGAICVDRSRGTLTHMLVTDLTNSEIVLGKLAARLLPVFALVGATVPVLALAGLLGGIIADAIVTLTAVTFATAILGCALALAFSVRSTKVHEVLMAVYGIESIWVVGPLVWMILQELGVPFGPPEWFWMINPFVLAWAPYDTRNPVGLEIYAMTLCAMLVLSSGLVLYAVFRLRAEAKSGTRTRRWKAFSWISRARAWVDAKRFSPSLDHDPVLWRECRRGRPSRLARIIWGCYFALAIAGTAWSIFMITCVDADSETVGVLSGIQVTFGLLLVSIMAPTALAEERARGSLEVLMTTPLTTDQIVLAKWRAAFRIVPAVALLPAIGALVFAFTYPESPPTLRRSAEHLDPMVWIDRVAFAILPTALLLAQGAVVTSVGLALATWMRRLGRAMAVSVTAYALVAFGYIVPLELGVCSGILSWLGLIRPGDEEAQGFYELISAAICPLGGQITTFQSTTLPATLTRQAFYIGHVILLLFMIGVALLFLALTLATFNRAMSRMSERPRRAPRPPRKLQATLKPHKPATGSREPVLAGINA